MFTRNRTIFAWLMVVGLILACVPSVTVPGAATPVPGAVNTFIAQTAEAAMTATARALPSSTPTETVTPTPRNTDTPTPTETPTVIFILSSPTPIVIPTFTRVSSGGGGSGSGGSSSSSFSCRVEGQDPPNGAAFNPRTDFDGRWTVRNNGQRTWERNSVDYIYLSGDQFHKVSGYDFATNVAPGGTTDIIVDMQAPKNPGTYTTRWSLRVGSDNFCTLSLTIVVR